MNKTTNLIIIAAVLLAGCTQGEAPEPAAELPVRYASLELADIGDAEALTARCAEEEALFREHFAALEAFDGTPTLAGYYRSLDSLFASLQTVSFTASSLAGVHPDKELRDAGRRGFTLRGISVGGTAAGNPPAASHGCSPVIAAYHYLSVPENSAF